MMQHVQNWDVALFRMVNTPRGPLVDVLMLAATWAGEYGLIWWIVGGVLMVRWRRWDWRLVASLVAAVLLSVVATDVAKSLWFRDRPFQYLEGVRRLGLLWEDSAFPSGHAVSSFAAATIIAKSELRWRVWAYLFASFIGLSRSYCGMHHPFDVAAGAGMGLGAGWLVVWVACRMWRESNRANNVEVLSTLEETTKEMPSVEDSSSAS